MVLRYAAATATTLLALAGAQLMVANGFIAAMVGLTLLGVPVSMALRQNEMKIGSVQLSRPLWNALTVLAAILATLYFLSTPLVQMVLPLLGDQGLHQFWMIFAPERFAALLMQAFLLFAAFRSFALISDKDATLCTVPSFSVLLLLIPVHKGIEVVFYFLAWTIMAAVLFALDHRSELRAESTARVPPALPGQDVRLGARSLASILGLSLLGATAISFFLASRDVAERSNAEVAVADLAARLTRFALGIPEISTNNGPERQIDFSNSPTLPTRAELWQVSARAVGGQRLRPLYWRMLTLSSYDSRSWSQGRERTKRLSVMDLSPEVFPPRYLFRRPEELGFDPRFTRPQPPRNLNGPTSNSSSPSNSSNPPSFDQQVRNFNASHPASVPGAPGGSPPGGAASPGGSPPGGSIPGAGLNGFGPNAFPARGFAVAQGFPEAKFRAGSNEVMVRQDISALRATLGFLPILPSVRAIQVDNDRRELRVRSDGVINFGTMKAGEWVRAVSDVPALSEYGFTRAHAPARRLSAGQIAVSKIGLSDAQRSAALQLPPSLPPRLRALGRSVLQASAPDESNFRRAQRLALAVQRDATYTLHPPPIPEGRDAADFFLFEGGRRGYCTYFAGALTVLCRSQGIPARVVSGFINTDLQRSDSVTFREANAHAWTEVWVEGWGWAVVDATPADDRGQNAPNWVESWRQWGSFHFARWQFWARGHWMVIALFGALLGAMTAWKRGAPLPWRRRSRSKAPDDAERRLVIETYQRVSRQMSRRIGPRGAWQTPDEWLQSTGAQLSPSDSEALRRLAALYTAALYSPKSLPAGSAALARHTAAGIGWKKRR